MSTDDGTTRRLRVQCERCGAQLGYVIRTVRGNYCEPCHDIIWADVPEMIWNAQPSGESA